MQKQESGRQPQEKTTLMSGKFLRLVKENGWEYAERTNVCGIVAMVPCTGQEFVFVEQFRQPVHARVIEFPAGLAGDKQADGQEPLLSAASRELVEETGFQAQHLIKVAEGPASAGAGSEIITFYLAEGLKKVSSGGGESTESIIVHLVPIAETQAWLQQQEALGKLVDLKVYTGLYLYAMHRGFGGLMTEQHP